MQVAYGAESLEYYSWGPGRTQAYVSASITDNGNDTVSLRVEGCVQSVAPNNMSQYGVMVQAGQGGGNGTAAGWVERGGVINYQEWVPNPYASGTWTFAKLTSAYNVTVWTKYWGAEVSGYGGCANNGELFMTVTIPARPLRPPSAPSGLVARRAATGVIGLTWTNNATNASSTLIERAPYGGGWQTIIDRGSILTSYSDSVGTGTYKYRVRYWNGDGFSGYSNESEWVTALCAPAAPTCVLPASGSTLSTDVGKPIVTWRHNALDTSAQTGAQVKYTTDAWAHEMSASATTTASTTLEVGGNLDIQWKVRTIGAYDGDGNAEDAWSPWSAVSAFKMRTPPSVAPDVDAVVHSVPVKVAWTYNDAMGTQASAEVSILDRIGGRALYTGRVQGASNAITIDASAWTPENGKSYAVKVTAVSTTSLQAMGGTTFRVEYTPPAKPVAAFMVDEERHAVVIRVETGEGEVIADAMTVFRDGLAVAQGLRQGATATDPTPPLDRAVTYRVVAYAASGATSEVNQTVLVPSRGFACINFGADMAKMRRNLSCPDGIKGEAVLREVASATRPKAFYGPHASREHTLSGEVWAFDDATSDGELATLGAWRTLEAHTGNVTLRLPFGDVIRASVSVAHDQDASAGNRAKVDVDWAEVDE